MEPIYKDVARKIRENIKRGEYSESNKLPTVEEFTKIYSVSKNTIRSAIDLLVSQGYVYMLQGSGIFLRQSSKEGCINITNMNGHTEDLKNKSIVTKVLEFNLTEADEVLAEKMKCKVGNPVYFVKRLRVVDGQPFCIESSFFNKDVMKYLNMEIVQGSIYHYFTEELGCNIGFADKVVSCEMINKDDAELMNMDNNQATLIVENIVYLPSGVIFDVSKVIYDFKKVKLINMSTNR